MVSSAICCLLPLMLPAFPARLNFHQVFILLRITCGLSNNI